VVECTRSKLSGLPVLSSCHASWWSNLRARASYTLFARCLDSEKVRSPVLIVATNVSGHKSTILCGYTLVGPIPDALTILRAAGFDPLSSTPGLSIEGPRDERVSSIVVSISAGPSRGIIQSRWDEISDLPTWRYIAILPVRIYSTGMLYPWDLRLSLSAIEPRAYSCCFRRGTSTAMRNRARKPKQMHEPSCRSSILVIARIRLSLLVSSATMSTTEQEGFCLWSCR